jgi:hypothetical protein
MVESMRSIVKDVPVKVEPKLMRRWDKKAKTVLDDQGNLRIWESK